MANTTIPSELIQASVALGGSPTTTTQSASDNTTKIATTAYVTAAVNSLIDSAPGTMNTLNEIAAALNDDASFNTTVTNAIATKLPLGGGTMTGNIAHASDFTIDAGGDIILDADGGDVFFYDGGATFGKISKGGGSDLIIGSTIADKDIFFTGIDSGTSITALTLDMSNAGLATFNAGGTFGGAVQLNDGQLNVHSSGASAIIGSIGNTANDLNIFSTSTGHNGLRFHANGILPTNNSGAIIDNDADLGDPSYRFKDLYLSGNVKIGTGASPVNTDADNLVIMDTGGAAGITLSSANNSVGRIDFADSDARRGMIYYSHISDYFRFDTGGTERLRIDSSGNVDLIQNNHLRWKHAAGGTIRASIDADSSDNLMFYTGSSETKRMTIDSAGRVGIGVTNTVGRELCVKGEVAAISTGSTDTHILMGASDSIVNIAATYSSSGSYVPIAFETSGQERMRIDSSGNVGIGGTPASGRNLHVHGIIRVQNTQNANYPVMEFFNTNGQVGGIRTSNSVTSYDTSSDYRLKENVQPIPNGLARLQQLNPVKFDWKVDGTSSEGFIAHEVQEIFPDAVGGEKDGEEMQAMDYGKITPLLVKAIQEQQAQIEILKTEIQELKDNG